MEGYFTNTISIISNNKIAAKEQELAKAQQNSQAQYGNYYHRAKMMVEKGSVTYLEVLLNSKSFSDLLSRYSVVKQIVRYDSNRLDELKAIETQIAALKKELESEKANLVADEDAEVRKVVVYRGNHYDVLSKDADELVREAAEDAKSGYIPT